MKTAVVNSNDLKECWSAKKYVSDCVGCANYERCSYKDRHRDPNYDNLLYQKQCTQCVNNISAILIVV